MANKQSTTVTIDLKMEVQQTKASLEKIQQAMSKLQLPVDTEKRFGKVFDEIAKKIENIGLVSAKGFKDSKEMDKYVQEWEKLRNLLNTTMNDFNSLSIDPSKLEPATKAYQDMVKQIEKAEKAQRNFNKTVEKTGAEGLKGTAHRDVTSAAEKRISNSAKSQDIPGIEKARVVAVNQLVEKSRYLDQDNKNILITNKQSLSVAEEYSAELSRQIALRREFWSLSKGSKQKEDSLIAANSQYRAVATVKVPELEAKQKVVDSATGAYKDINKVNTMASEQTQNVSSFVKVNEEVKTLSAEMGTLKSKLQTTATEGMQTISKESEEAAININNAKAKTQEFTSEQRNVENTAKSFSNLGDKLKQLTGATMVLSQVRRAIQGIWEDFKQLDKQFSGISVVTGKSMEELWGTFSKVNKVAQQFGVTSTNVLAVQRFYYEQGKKTSEVNQLTAETLTLAKISGLEYADATDKMTAAINAFRISAEEASTVTDTWAALAAGAAADTAEIGNAMSKTASIAANAGMNIQSTSVFLTKMIETTRESSENLGTALKSIIARFQELKTLKDEDDDGSVIDANKVETALRVAEVSLREQSGQFKDLDSVFMELSSKWDGLDRNTQRYIATVAAGSRQQSRFIAMMENYSRTLELTDLAQNSAGVGAEQLALSQESIETSLNNLSSAWQELYTHFTNSDFFKGLIDSLTNTLQLLNRISETSSVLGPMVVVLIASLASVGARAGIMFFDKFTKSGAEAIINFKKNLSSQTYAPVVIPVETQEVNSTKEVVNKNKTSPVKTSKTGKVSKEITDAEREKIKTYKDSAKVASENAKASLEKANAEKQTIATSIAQSNAVKGTTAATIELNATKYASMTADELSVAVTTGQITAEQASQLTKAESVVINNEKIASETAENLVSAEGITVDAAGLLILEARTKAEEKRILQEKILASWDSMNIVQKTIINALTAVENLQTAFDIKLKGKEAIATGKQTVSTWGLVAAKLAQVWASGNLAKAAIVTAGVIAAGAVVAGVAAVATANMTTETDKASNAASAASDATSKYKKSLVEYNAIVKDYIRYQKLKNKGDAVTAEEQKELLELTKSLADSYPELVASYDDEGNAILRNSDALKDLIEKKAKLVELNRDLATSNTTTAASMGVYGEGTTGYTNMKNIKELSGTYGDAQKGTAGYEQLQSWANGMQFANAKDLQKAFKTFSEDNAAFNKKTWGAMSGEDLNSKQWKTIVSKFNGVDTSKMSQNSIDDLFSQALTSSSEYTQSTINSLVKMNRDLGNSFSNMFASIESSLKEITIDEQTAYIKQQFNESELDMPDLVSTMGRILGEAKYSADKKTQENYKTKKDSGYTGGYLSGADVDETEVEAALSSASGNNAKERTISFTKANKKIADALNKGKKGWVSDYFVEAQKQIDNILGEQGTFDVESITSDLADKLSNKEQTEINSILAGYENVSKEDQAKYLQELVSVLAKAGVDPSGQSAKYVEYALRNNFITAEDKTKEYAKNVAALTRQNENTVSNMFTSYSKNQASGISQALDAVYAEAYKTSPEEAYKIAANFFYSFDKTLKSVADNSELEKTLGSIDWMDIPSIEAGRLKLVQAYGEGSDAVKAFDSTVQNSGSILNKTLYTTEELFAKLKTDLGTLSTEFEDISKASEGTLDIEGVATLLEASDKLSASDFTATAEGFKLSTAASVALRKELALQKIAEYRRLKVNYERQKSELETAATVAERAAIEAMAAANLERIDSVEKITLLEKAAVAKKLAEQSRSDLDALTSRYDNADEAIKILSMSMNQVAMSTAKADAEIQDTTKSLQSFIDALNELDRYSNIDTLIDKLSGEIDYLDSALDMSSSVTDIANLTKQKIEKVSTVIGALQIKVQTAEDTLANFANNDSLTQLENSFSSLGLGKFDFYSMGIDGDVLFNYDSFNDYVNNLYIANKLTDEQITKIEGVKKQFDSVIEEYNKEVKVSQDSKKQILENIQALKELQDKALEDTTTLENKLLELIQNRDEKELEAIKNKYDLIKEEDEKYLDSVKESVEKERKLRDTSQDYEDLAKKEKQLSLLKMGGGSKSDIESLEKEISDDRESLADSEVDNLLDNISKEYDAKAVELDQEVTYQEQILSRKKSNMIQYNAEVASLMQQDKSAILIFMKSLDDGYITGTVTAQAQWESEWERTIANAKASQDGDLAASLNNLRQIYSHLTEDENGTSFESKVNSYTNAVINTSGSVANAVNNIASTYGSAYNQLDNMVRRTEDLAQATANYNNVLANAAQSTNVGNYTNTTGGESTTDTQISYEPVAPAVVYDSPLDLAGAGDGKNHWTFLFRDTDGDGDINADSKIGGISKSYKKDGWEVDGEKNDSSLGHFYHISTNKGDNFFVHENDIREILGSNSGTLDGKRWSPYKTGGLVDYTGPAWVDGTKSKPEAFLSASDTMNIASLTNVLSAMSSISPNSSAATASSVQNNGDITYEIHIEVAELGDGYTVDDLAKEMEQKIVNAYSKGKVIQVR